MFQKKKRVKEKKIRNRRDRENRERERERERQRQRQRQRQRDRDLSGGEKSYWAEHWYVLRINRVFAYVDRGRLRPLSCVSVGKFVTYRTSVWAWSPNKKMIKWRHTVAFIVDYLAWVTQAFAVPMQMRLCQVYKRSRGENGGWVRRRRVA